MKANRIRTTFSVLAWLTAALLFAGITAGTARAYEVLRTPGGEPIYWDNPECPYYINESGAQSGFATAVRNAASTWTGVSGSAFVFNYEGQTSSTDWGENDGQNIFVFQQFPIEGVLGATSYFSDLFGNMLDTDVLLNTNYAWAVDGRAGALDVQTIALHELGHALGLADLYDPLDEDKVMFGYGSEGNLKRELTDDDRDGVAYLYPGDSDVAYGYEYYVPLAQADGDVWTGIGVRNLAGSEAEVAVIPHSPGGGVGATVTRTIAARGQTALVADAQAGDGWLLVRSTQELSGLAFVFKPSYPSYMFDVPFVTSLSNNWIAPHAANDWEWSSTLHLANPDVDNAIVTCWFRGPGGDNLYSKVYIVPAGGSSTISLSDIVQGTDQPSGSIEVNSTRPVAAFLFFDNLKSGGNYAAGLNATPVTSF